MGERVFYVDGYPRTKEIMPPQKDLISSPSAQPDEASGAAGQATPRLSGPTGGHDLRSGYVPNSRAKQPATS